MSLLLYATAASVLAVLLVRCRRISVATALVLALLPLTLTGRALFTGDIYGPLDLAYTNEPIASMAARVNAGAIANPAISDVYTEFFPWNAAVRYAIANGQWPHWNPFVLAGTPLEAAVQIALYHPITILQHFLPLESGITAAAALAYLLAAVAAFLLAFELTRSEGGSLIAAAGWMFSTSVIFFAGTALGLSLAAMPLVLLGARRTALDPGLRSGLILGGALTLLVVSGHPETTLHTVAFAIVYLLFTLKGGERVDWKKLLPTGLLAGIGTLLLCAVYLLPFFAALFQSEEYAHRTVLYDDHRFSVPPPQLIHRLIANFFPFLDGAPGVESFFHPPDIAHSWIGIFYGGWLLLALASCGLALGRGRERLFFAGAFVFGVAMAIGTPGLTEAVQLIPGFSIALNDRMVAFASLGAAMLAAMAVAAVRDRPRTMAMIFVASAAVVIAAALLVRPPLSVDFVRVGVARAVLPLIVGAAALRVLRPQSAVAMLLILVVVQRVGEASWMQPTVSRAAFYPDFPGVELMQTAEPSRMTGVGPNLVPNLSTHYLLEDVRGFEALTLHRYTDTFPLWSVRRHLWSNEVSDLSSPFLSALNVRFAIAPPAYSLPGGWIERHRQPGYVIAENTKVLPRAWIPEIVHSAARTETVAAMARCDDFARESWLERNGPSNVKNGTGRVTATRQGANLRLRATIDEAAWIVVSNSAWDGWRATSRGKEIPLSIANHTMLALQLPPGEHDVELHYTAAGFREGVTISMFTAAVLIGAGFGLRRRRRLRAGSADAAG